MQGVTVSSAPFVENNPRGHRSIQRFSARMHGDGKNDVAEGKRFLPYALAFVADDKNSGSREHFGRNVARTVRRESVNMKKFIFEGSEHMVGIADGNKRNAECHTRRRFYDCSGDGGLIVFRNQNAGDAERRGTADDGADVMRVLEFVQEDECGIKR